MDLKAFYFEQDPDAPELALNMDVLAPEGYGEIIGGGQREDDRSRRSRRRSTTHKLPREAFEWYLDLRRYGTLPARGVRPRHRADGGVDLRAAARAGDHPVPADAEPPLALTQAPSLRTGHY